jgi:hypothetical protein
MAKRPRLGILFGLKARLRAKTARTRGERHPPATPRYLSRLHAARLPGDVRTLFELGSHQAMCQNAVEMAWEIGMGNIPTIFS